MQTAALDLADDLCPLVHDLEAGEQFFIWALRQRSADGSPHGHHLVRGFLFVFGLSTIERSIASFETVYRTITDYGIRRVSFGQLCRRELSQDELALLRHLSAADHGQPAWSIPGGLPFLHHEGWLLYSKGLADLARLISGCEFIRHGEDAQGVHARSALLNLH